MRSGRGFCEQLGYNLLFRWFLDTKPDGAGPEQSNFSRLCVRVVETGIAHNFVDQVLGLAKAHRPPIKDGGDGAGMVNFKGERRTNQTHQSSTDPEAKLTRRGNGQPAKLCFGGNALMENRSGCVPIC